MADNPQVSPDDFVIFGPNSNCTLELCPIEWSVYQYRPSLPANATFLALYVIALLLHVYLGIMWRTRGFMCFMAIGCSYIIIGYVGRIMLYYNPWSFTAFILQIICVSSGPVFFSAAIYLTLSRVVTSLGPEISRFRPKLFFWGFISADIICLSFQAAGGGLSTTSNGSSQAGITLAMVGLILQVVMMAIFTALLIDYLVRFVRQNPSAAYDVRLRLFFGFLGLALVLLLARCCFRCYELNEGYRDSSTLTNEGLFIGLECVLVTVAAFALCIGHPGILLGPKSTTVSNHVRVESSSGHELLEMRK
ncbi:hypothetical protein S40285_05382 [Stachybotrys chlorohalonatus IBT 40285]|uniref:Sphingoid long-chain base transporter RSB1 n=1 Tax=Stachybotrys chlorohalonatus (strain IBT 40285) TaxID=1283841 RepID=A0A084QX20_STAC4|nr:hypothetical protein S40285_05382 [Stachybotrys chlorohalonata IBT 40285]